MSLGAENYTRPLLEWSSRFTCRLNWYRRLPAQPRLRYVCTTRPCAQTINNGLAAQRSPTCPHPMDSFFLSFPRANTFAHHTCLKPFTDRECNSVLQQSVASLDPFGTRKTDRVLFKIACSSHVTHASTTATVRHAPSRSSALFPSRHHTYVTTPEFTPVHPKFALPNLFQTFSQILLPIHPCSQRR